MNRHCLYSFSSRCCCCCYCYCTDLPLSTETSHPTSSSQSQSEKDIEGNHRKKDQDHPISDQGTIIVHSHQSAINIDHNAQKPRPKDDEVNDKNNNDDDSDFVIDEGGEDSDSEDSGSEFAPSEDEDDARRPKKKVKMLDGIGKGVVGMGKGLSSTFVSAKASGARSPHNMGGGGKGGPRGGGGDTRISNPKMQNTVKGQNLKASTSQVQHNGDHIKGEDDDDDEDDQDVKEIPNPKAVPGMIGGGLPWRAGQKWEMIEAIMKAGNTAENWKRIALDVNRIGGLEGKSEKKLSVSRVLRSKFLTGSYLQCVNSQLIEEISHTYSLLPLFSL